MGWAREIPWPVFSKSGKNSKRGAENMRKIVFIGAGSMVFTRNLAKDLMGIEIGRAHV